ncbi:AAA family ATPase [Clostridium beijerinckii]|uniref:AAA family ATPase n=1 Tax=Clostridium beijerinckii TaxID=1520 RepID=A0AAW3W2W0_CLOBE|nr:AAA family ATPase [Clostridium beijerinckii]MBC2455657.1 AAA family ATPase [Clostridium beijerinckii]MBC2473134.1 AAA family ATPase [Clostridium beijerinckii]NOV62362.1 putative ATPase [Clostridium beijerinckii]NOV68141.1 putative ATPase [Clostridium beijerinckii]NOW30414.1 putative ATPase [Clostridium beijerinckii]
MTNAELQGEINSLYKRIIRNNKSAKYFKCDLHVHSPASKDYVRNNIKNTDEEEYRLFLDDFIKSDADVIAITDHNICRGYYDIKRIIDSDKELKYKLYNKLILPGIEITCYGKHFLAIFSPDCSENKLNSLLMEAGIDIEEQGTEKASADRLSPLTLCEKVETYGGIIIIAHADAENGLLQNYFKNKKTEDSVMRGKSIEKILKSKSIYGICYNSEINYERLIDLKINFKLEDVSVLKASDSHCSNENYSGSGVPLGSRASWLNMGKLSYNALKLALRDESSRVKNSKPIEKTNPNVIGLCVNGGFLFDNNGMEWSIIPFSEGLNCIVGARGTGKSTMIDILKLMLNPKNEDVAENIIGRFDKSVAFIKNNNNVFAIRMNNPVSKNKLNLTYYQLIDNSFKKLSKNAKVEILVDDKLDEVVISEYLNSAEIQGFRQKDILELAKINLGPTMLIRSLCQLVYKDEYFKLEKELELIKSGIKEQWKELKREERFDNKADVSSEYLDTQYNRFIVTQRKLDDCIENVINKLNMVLKSELKIVYSTEIPSNLYREMIKRWVLEVRKNSFGFPDRLRRIEKWLLELFEKAKSDYGIMYKLSTFKVDDIANEYKIDSYIVKQLCQFCFKKINSYDLVITPQTIIDYELNVAYGISNKDFYVHRNNLSFGQKAVGMLLLILTGATQLGENRPLVIDQPEDDLDNSYIYHTLVKQFKVIKNSRQLIIATHNPNIPIAGDAENILIMKSNGEHGWVELSGNIDNEKVADRVLQILEGDIDAFEKRAEKYGYKLVKVNS